jgi:hypothetical protein
MQEVMTKGDNSQVYQEQEEGQESGLHPQFICNQVSKQKTGSYNGRLGSRQKMVLQINSRGRGLTFIHNYFDARCM